MNRRPLKMPNYGGQALIEGVLMRGSKWVTAAYRLPNGTIYVEEKQLTGLYRSPVARIPFLRGLVILWDALILGMQFLTRSANFQTAENEKIEGGTLTLTLIGSFVIFVGLFFIIPAALGKWLGGIFFFSTVLTNLIEGLIRLSFLILYLWLIGKEKDIERVFAYHGAEHKTINAYEAGVDLNIESIQKCSLRHPRCGTGFILSVAVISVLVFALFGNLPWYALVLSRILLIPVIVMLAYEYIRIVSNHLSNPIIRLLAEPNLAMQSFTTRNPTSEMVEVALTSFLRMKELEELKDIDTQQANV